MPVNPHEYAARQKKATALADAIENAGITGDQVGKFDEHTWETAAHHAAVKLPSDTTRKMVIAELLIREAGRKR